MRCFRVSTIPRSHSYGTSVRSSWGRCQHIIDGMDDQEFRRLSDESLEKLKRSLYEAEGEADFEVEDNAGALHINFEDPPGKFVISPNAPVRQIWISALSTSFKLDWS